MALSCTKLVRYDEQGSRVPTGYRDRAPSGALSVVPSFISDDSISPGSSVSNRPSPRTPPSLSSLASWEHTPSRRSVSSASSYGSYCADEDRFAVKPTSTTSTRLILRETLIVRRRSGNTTITTTPYSTVATKTTSTASYQGIHYDDFLLAIYLTHLLKVLSIPSTDVIRFLASKRDFADLSLHLDVMNGKSFGLFYRGLRERHMHTIDAVTQGSGNDALADLTRRVEDEWFGWTTRQKRALESKYVTDSTGSTASGGSSVVTRSRVIRRIGPCELAA